jgi:ribosomal protein L21
LPHAARNLGRIKAKYCDARGETRENPTKDPRRTTRKRRKGYKTASPPDLEQTEKYDRGRENMRCGRRCRGRGRERGCGRFSVVGGVVVRADGELDVASGDLVDVDKVLTAAGEVLVIVARPEAVLSVDGLSVLGESVGAPCKVRLWSATCTRVKRGVAEARTALATVLKTSVGELSVRRRVEAGLDGPLVAGDQVLEGAGVVDEVGVAARVCGRGRRESVAEGESRKEGGGKRKTGRRRERTSVARVSEELGRGLSGLGDKRS